MATTPVYGLRYQTASDPPNGADLGERLAQDVETQLARIDAAAALFSSIQDWTTYTPSIQNIGSAAFSTQTGYWCRPFSKLVVYTAYFVVSTAGTGTLNVGYKLPTIPFRTSTRQTVGTGVRGDSPNLVAYVPIIFAGGTDEFVDRIVKANDTTAYMQGADLAVGRIITFSGVYREA